MSLRRVAFILIVVVLLAAGIGMALLGGDGGQATQLGSYSGGESGTPVAGDTTAPMPSAAATSVIDPAKEEPVLDKFTSKDPFAPLTGSAPTSVPTTTPTTTPTSTPENPTSAKVTILGSSYTVKAGDETPSSDPVFRVSSVTPDGVTFELLNNQQFDDGSSSVQVPEGETVTVTNADTGSQYQITVNTLNYGQSGGGGGGSGGGGSSGGASTMGHRIKLLSINTQNGTDTATFKVDGATYADEGVGEEFTTDWGQIRVLAIDAGRQTVTILHGDDTLVIHVGQTLEK